MVADEELRDAGLAPDKPAVLVAPLRPARLIGIDDLESSVP